MIATLSMLAACAALCLPYVRPPWASGVDFVADGELHTTVHRPTTDHARTTADAGDAPEAARAGVPRARRARVVQA